MRPLWVFPAAQEGVWVVWSCLVLSPSLCSQPGITYQQPPWPPLPSHVRIERHAAVIFPPSSVIKHFRALIPGL